MAHLSSVVRSCTVAWNCMPRPRVFESSQQRADVLLTVHDISCPPHPAPRGNGGYILVVVTFAYTHSPGVPKCATEMFSRVSPRMGTVFLSSVLEVTGSPTIVYAAPLSDIRSTCRLRTVMFSNSDTSSSGHVETLLKYLLNLEANLCCCTNKFHPVFRSNDYRSGQYLVRVVYIMSIHTALPTSSAVMFSYLCNRRCSYI